MSTLPRVNETVTIPASFGSAPQRYTVHEVIHHLRGQGVVRHEDEEDPPTVLNKATCLVSQLITPSDLGRVVTALCMKNGNVPKLS